MSSYKNNNYSFLNSIHHILVNHGKIPETLSPQDFYSDMGIIMKNDDKIMKGGNIKKICKNIIIDHEDNKIQNVVKGVNVLLIERDCNNDFDRDYFENMIGGDNMIIMKDGNFYTPLYAINERTKERTGLFTKEEMDSIMED